MLTSVNTSLAISAVFYLTPRAFGWLCSKPETVKPNGSYLDSIRLQLSECEMKISQVGGRNWGFFTAVVLDNSWISMFVISLLLKHKADRPMEHPVLLSALMIIPTSTLCWLIRRWLVKTLPASSHHLASWLSPKDPSN